MSGQNPREIAVQVLSGQGRGYIEERLDKSLEQSAISGVDRRLCQELVYGVVRWQAALDWLIARKTDGRAQAAKVQNLLRLGLYQIFWLERIPAHAALFETVEAAKRSGLGAKAGFINAMLRGYMREFEATKQLLAELKNTQPNLGYSHPEWLVARWRERWGAQNTARLMEWNNTPPKTFARVNALKTDAAKLLTQWREEGVEYVFVQREWVEENLVFELKSHPPLSRLASFEQGLFYVQDPSTLLAVRELDPRPGESVLDLCAAPGGKLTYIAQLMRNEGRLVAHDITEDRLKLIEENCARLGVTCVKAILPSTLNPQPSTLFDRILLDAPCSNTGAMRRRVDLRWRIRPKEILRLRALQLELLRQAAGLLKAGGTLVYSTCSLELEENKQVITEFLSSEAGFKLQTERELTPFSDGVDGAYVVRMVRGRFQAA